MSRPTAHTGKLQLHRPDMHRGEERTTITAATQPHYSQLVDMAWTPEPDHALGEAA